MYGLRGLPAMPKLPKIAESENQVEWQSFPILDSLAIPAMLAIFLVGGEL
jgi:hypothetical protein